LKSKLFPAKIPFSKMQKKNLAGKIYFAKKWILLCKGMRSFGYNFERFWTKCWIMFNLIPNFKLL
jgi:hypothetical protein